MADLGWGAALARYRAPRQLKTRARKASFSVQTFGRALLVTPASGRQRRLTEGEFDRSLPLLGLAGRGPLQATTWNSSYIEAIVGDLRQA